jgi:hypothetical protein
MTMADVLSHPRFQDEQAAYDWVEAHLWPDGLVRPRCGVTCQTVRGTGLEARAEQAPLF